MDVCSLCLRRGLEEMATRQATVASPSGEAEFYAAEKAVQSFCETMRVVKAGPEARLSIKVEDTRSHAVTARLTEHSVGVLSNVTVGEDRRTPCDRWKANSLSQDVSDIGKHANTCAINRKFKARDEKMGATVEAGARLGKMVKILRPAVVKKEPEVMELDTKCAFSQGEMRPAKFSHSNPWA